MPSFWFHGLLRQQNGDKTPRLLCHSESVSNIPAATASQTLVFDVSNRSRRLS